jgi:hypothetical protein
VRTARDGTVARLCVLYEKMLCFLFISFPTKEMRKKKKSVAVSPQSLHAPGQVLHIYNDVVEEEQGFKKQEDR